MDVAWNPEWNGRNQRWQASRKGSIQEVIVRTEDPETTQGLTHPFHPIMLLFQVLFAGLLLVTASKAKIGYFWHITDIHYDVHYSVKGDTRKSV
ncbi:hypothetical protein LSTR_LSTR008272 [Laodelphax striatellus]|uniref:Uncharacterized protein n=1 Tax=Laodelphax striatellus TaxID=195883 RepID=A0A482XNZ2_LAOST|nr:hypothetical protein LSTR_LSTR008272 [Laodelphax striatellus]